MLVSNAQEQLHDFFADFWSLQTAYAPSNWTAGNPARGQCVPTSLAIQKYLGGDIVKCRLSFSDGSEDETHYWNVIGEEELDPTFIQYADRKIDNEIFIGIVHKEKLLADPDTRTRYGHFMDTMNAASNPAEFFSQLKLSRNES